MSAHRWRYRGIQLTAQVVEDEARQLLNRHPYVNTIIKLFNHLRTQLGDEVELLHDVHERIPPIQAINLAKGLEPYNLFFLEDPFAPEDVDYFQLMRQQTSIPIAMASCSTIRTSTSTLSRTDLLILSEYISHRSVVSVQRVNLLRFVNSSVSARHGTVGRCFTCRACCKTSPWIWHAIISGFRSSTSSATTPKRSSGLSRNPRRLFFGGN